MVSTSLADRAILVDLSISQWSARKLDRKQTNDLNARAGARRTVARVNKTLLPGSQSLEAATRKASAIRDWFYARTLPWAGSARILRSEHYLDFTTELNDHIAAWERLVDQFVAEYPVLAMQAKLELNGLYDPDDYPDASEIRRRFRIDVRFAPVPVADDWRVTLSDEAMAALRESVTRDVQRAQQNAMQEAWRRLHECVQHAVDKLSDPKAIFRDSLVDNALELCKVLPSLNIADDPELEARRQELERALCGVTPKDLRKRPDVRKSTADQLNDIVRKMGSFYAAAA